MSPSKRLKPVREVSASREQDAARALGRAQGALFEQETRLQELQSYLGDYESQLSNEAGTAVLADRLQEYHHFLGRLNQAIAQQRRRVEEARTACEAQRQQWMAARTRVQVLDKAVERHQKAERSEAERLEQRDADELVTARRPRETEG